MRTSVSIHREVIAILHLIGARDGYIASEFQAHVLTSIAGGLIGGLLAVATLAGIAAMLEPEAVDGSNLFPALIGGLPAGIVEWVIIASAPTLVAFVARIAARLSVLEALRKISP